MKTEQKANELVEKFETLPINFPYIDTVDGRCIGAGYMTHKSAVKCAIIAVEEILNANPTCIDRINSTHKFWQEVKSELIKRQ